MKRNLPSGHYNWVGCGIQLFSDFDVEAIHCSTLEVLEKTGINVKSDRAIDIFEQAGADVDRENKIVRIPVWMVEEAVRTAPRKILLAGRDPENDIIVEYGRVYVTPFGTGVTVIDPYTGECRPSTKKDIEQLATITDYLDQMDVCWDTVIPRDVNPHTVCLHSYEAHVANTTKHMFVSPENTETAQLLIEMAGKVVGGKENLKARPIITGLGCPISPLTWPEFLSDSLIEFAKEDLPFLVLTMAMAGGTGPVTLAGTLVTINAEILTGVVLSQLVKKGAPVIYGSSTTNFDLRKATATVGSPELGLISAGVAKMAQYYNLPSFVAGG
ncbi:Glycine betaine methyltransferase [Sporomusa paucivorans]|jgi:trimethylamine--corrinoid protein Co-methyltransferase|uniref:Trimethylamine methyltransferase (MTTB) n=1 Tax=Sporomusa sphaeroides DSM 2875 TaxID=1337886 RepID=A0ABP2C896_9FIRM|nr:trimethylamine methyltransferase MttB [Sporomusa sphaeroides DSM 2875]CVK19554.1 Trimethylamine methyltransferase (MTTB) [Sporomusa sphaeroides DSM 2875]